MTRPHDLASAGTPLARFDAGALRATLATFRDAMRSHQAAINRLNVYPVPDGDTGTNMARTLDAVLAELEGAGGDLGSTCHAIAHGSLMGARGNSGVILSQILRGIVEVLREEPEAGPVEVARALTAAAAAAYDAVLTPVEGTILTVARESADAAARVAAGGATLAETLVAARAEAAASLARTPQLLQALADAGVVDAGGAGFLLLLDSLAHVVAGVPLPDVPQIDGSTAAVLAPPSTDIGEMRYEVMYLLALDDSRIGDLKRTWGGIGDSVVVVGGDGTWNCHVHTNDIGAAIESALDLGGRPSRIRVTDLFEEVAELEGAAGHAQRETDLAGGHTAHAAVHDRVTCAVVAVASGAGLAALFRDLGVQQVVSGGQTLNPSTAELLAAVEAAPANEVVVLPNNKNIIPVAEQLDSLTAKTVVVVPTRSMPEALAALVVYDPEGHAARNSTDMTDAAEAVATGEVTRAVRASASPRGPVSAGDWIGLVRGEGIVAVGTSVVTVATELLDQLVAPDRELITIVTGTDAVRADTESIVAWVDEARPGLEVEVHEGGQPLYPYLFGVE